MYEQDLAKAQLADYIQARREHVDGGHVSLYTQGGKFVRDHASNSRTNTWLVQEPQPIRKPSATETIL